MSRPVSKPIHVEMLQEGKGEICREILESLPEWFGIPEAIEAYARSVADLPMLVASDPLGRVIGFIALRPQTASAVEVYVMGVRREWHRNGCGRLLIEAGQRIARELGAKFLTVKTLAENHPDPNYRATRLFYEAIGFHSIEVFPRLWSPENPCLLMVKPVD
jgi:GNAT superfamily N-acetyltransferase